MSAKTEFVLVVAAGILVASMLDNIIGGFVNPIFATIKLAPYNG